MLIVTSKADIGRLNQGTNDMKWSGIFLIGGISSLLASFLVHRFFIQFIVIGVIFIVFYILNRNSEEIENLKKVINEHNGILKKDVDELKKTNAENIMTH